MPSKPTPRPARKLRRHPAGGGYARGARTRGRIIETAIDMFASLGYERTSTRAIAKRAAVSLPALQYYFGGKAGLHLACAQYITADVRERLAPAAERVSQALSRPRLKRAELLGLLKRVLEPFLESMATERPESWVLFFTRAQIERGAAFDVLFERVVGTITRLIAEIVARLIGRAPDDPEVLIRMLAVVGPIVVVRRGRPILLRTLGWPDLSGQRLSALKSALWTQILRGFSPR
jgi:TetR/AcrR family transcriptional regulator, regulator of cefoperazone and chloramphenicol sensitivity